MVSGGLVWMMVHEAEHELVFLNCDTAHIITDDDDTVKKWWKVPKWKTKHPKRHTKGKAHNHNCCFSLQTSPSTFSALGPLSTISTLTFSSSLYFLFSRKQNCSETSFPASHLSILKFRFTCIHAWLHLFVISVSLKKMGFYIFCSNPHCAKEQEGRDRLWQYQLYSEEVHDEFFPNKARGSCRLSCNVVQQSNGSERGGSVQRHSLRRAQRGWKNRTGFTRLHLCRLDSRAG